MSHPTSEKSESVVHLPKPIIKKSRWPVALIWLVPIFAAVLAGYYFYAHFQDRGPLITLKFSDVTGLKAGESLVMHLGVAIGQMEDTELSADQKQAIIHVRLKRSAAAFAEKGAMFWIVRPEISTQEISGLGTVLSGPFIGAIPGGGEAQTEFNGLQDAPITLEDGLRVKLKAPQLERLQADSPVYFRGIQVGVIESVELNSDAASVDVHIFIRHRFSALVKTRSQFWVVSGVDLKGGLFSGVQVKVSSFRSLLTGGIAFATPEQNMGDQAKDGAEFALYDEPKKDWLTWSPKIQIGPADSVAAEPIDSSHPPK